MVRQISQTSLRPRVMTRYFDDLETRTAEERAENIALVLPQQIERGKKLPGYCGRLDGVASAEIASLSSLARLPVLRKSDLGAAQQNAMPFGGLTTKPAGDFSHVFQSPGPIYETF